MKIAVCLDDKNGMTFFGRRQSMDSCLRKEFLTLCGTDKVWMDAYSAGQFSEDRDRILVDEAFLTKAGENDWCFVEKGDIASVAGQIKQIVLYRWNRHYPSDVKFPMALFADKWKLVGQRDFPGSSHERITEEVYSI